MDLNAILSQVSGAIIFMVIFVLFVFGYIFVTRYKNQKTFERDSKGEKIWVHFWTAAGNYDPIICNVDQFRVQPPEGHELTEYFVENDSVYSGWYPQGKGLINKLTRIRVPTTSYIANRREPNVSTNPKRWIESKDKTEITATMQRVAVNESFAKSAQALQSAAWKDIVGMAQFGKYAKYTFYGVLIMAFAIVILASMIYSLNVNVSNVMAAFFGK